jgi:predicted histone-like DNA-binding protein
MALKFKSRPKAQPGVPGGGVQKYYASIVFGDEVTVDDLVKDIEKFSSLSEPDIHGVIIALENMIQTRLSESRIVRLERLGSFYPSMSSEGRDTEEEVDSNCIRSVGVNYRPGSRILKALKDAGAKKIN